jgi:tetratricopeptide (TPR) repeat protein
VGSLRHALALAAGLVALPAPLRADVVDELAKRAQQIEGQAVEIEANIATAKVRGPSLDTADRHLVEAQVAYGMGNYADATVLLYDIVEKFPNSRAWPDAVFYLADSLYQKKDNLTARKYFHVIIEKQGDKSPHFQKALERLIELSIRLQDTARVPEYLALIDKIPQGSQLASVPYVRGKYLYFDGKLDEALKLFEGIPATSKHHFQAKYFAGTIHVAKGQLAPAAKEFHALTKLPGVTKTEKKIVELAHLALGRVHYERNQPREAIDHYLMIGRRSPVFDEALYEVAWVYVKAKQFDKALRALELLSLANPKSAMLPEVRILEGNLRIRKAQAIVGNPTDKGNTAEEFAKAIAVFETTRTTYEKPRQDLDALIASHEDPRKYFLQLTGKNSETLEVGPQVPEVALAWMKQEPDIGKILGVTRNLDEIRAELDDTGKLITRLERAVDSPSRVSIFPDLADRRSRVVDLTEQIFNLRQQLGTHERAIAFRYVTPEEKAALTVLQEKRKELNTRLAAMPNSGDSHTERMRKAREAYDAVDKRAKEVEVLIHSVEAEIVAIDKYYRDQQAAKKMPVDVFEKQMKELRVMVADLRKELDAIRADTTAASDEAGLGDELAREELEVRTALTRTVAEEHGLMLKITTRMSGDDQAKSRQIAQVMTKADHAEVVLKRTNTKIEQLTDAQLEGVKASIREEKVRLGEYRQTLAAYEEENIEIGTEVVYGSFENVSRKFYEIAIRADVGLLDVSWAQKEHSQQHSDKLRFDFAREKNILDSDFRDVSRHDEAGGTTP